VIERHPSLLRALERVLEIDGTNLRDVLSRAADVIADEVRADKVDVFVHDRASDTLVALGMSHTPMTERERAAGLDRLPVATAGRAAAVHLSREPFRIGDLALDPLRIPALVERVGVRSVMMVPFEFGPDGTGVLNVDSGEVDRFDDEDFAFTRAVARWIALVAHRSELTRTLAARAREDGRREAAEELVMVVAHDLRNVVAPALGRVQLLKRRAAREGRPRDERDASLAEHSLLRVVRLVSDLLDVARIDRGLFDLTPTAVDLVEVLQDVARALSDPKKPVSVRVEHEDLVMTGDGARLRQVFENLVSNAVKHAPDGTSVTIDMRWESGGEHDWAEIDVTNAGAPVPPELAPRIFERFVRAGSSTGLGLGLHLAREIVVAHGGTIALVPLETGARFRVRLPLR
jgi:two-component system OmpR family sensor kinase